MNKKMKEEIVQLQKRAKELITLAELEQHRRDMLQELQDLVSKQSQIRIRKWGEYLKDTKDFRDKNS